VSHFAEIAAAGVVRRADTLRHNALAAERASVLVEDRPLAAVVLAENDAAERSGMNRSYLSHLESGRRNPTLATLERLAKTLKVTPGYFFEDVSARVRRTKH
jgi:transcriptional regulator with XRE-family HTH domain